jgi:hypothetical protein
MQPRTSIFASHLHHQHLHLGHFETFQYEWSSYLMMWAATKNNVDLRLEYAGSGHSRCSQGHKCPSLISLRLFSFKVAKSAPIQENVPIMRP